MKKSVLILFVAIVLVSTTALALPNFWFSGTAYNSLGQIVVSPTTIELYITVTDGTNVYIEQYLSGGVGAQSVNDFGVFSVQIGTGSVVSGTLSSVTMKSTTTTNIKVRPTGSTTWVNVSGSSLTTVYINNYTAPSSLALPNGQIYVGNSAGNAQARTLSGDGSISNIGVFTLSNSGVAAATYGDAANIPQIIVDAKGRITSATNVAITIPTTLPPNGPAGGDLTGTYPNPVIAGNAVTSAKIADGTILNSDINTSAAIAVSKLAPGTNGQVLTTTGGVPTWGSGGTGITSPSDAATDDLLYYDGTNWLAKRLLIGNTGNNIPINNMQPYLVLNYCIALTGIFPSRNSAEPFIGEIELYGFNFAPRFFATCDGQILSIAQNTALFSLLGTTYGGNGQTTFALPDLRGRVAIHQGQGPGLTPRTIGEASGTETTTLLQVNMPAHTHQITYQ